MELVIRNIRKNFQEKEVLKGASYTFREGRLRVFLVEMVQVKPLFLTFYMENIRPIKERFFW